MDFETIEYLLTGIMYAGTTTSLIALCVYISLAVKGDSMLLLSTNDPTSLSWNGIVFLSLAAIGFLVCMYQGADAMLSWILGHWEFVSRETGERSSMRMYFAGTFALLGGVTLIQFLDEATRNKTHKRITRDKRMWERTIDETQSIKGLKEFKMRFQKEIDWLNSKPRHCWGIRGKSIWISVIEEEKEMYRELISRIDKLSPASPPEFTPEGVHAAFQEGVRVFAIECWNAASSMFITSINLATKDLISKIKIKEFDTYTFQNPAERLEWLFETERLPADLYDSASCVIENGYEEPYSETMLWEEEAKEFLDFTTALLGQIYPEPKKTEIV